MLSSEQVVPKSPAGHKHVRHELRVSGPVLAVFLPAPVLVARLSVVDHAQKEHEVKVGHRGVESAHQAPGRGHQDIPGVLQLATEGVPAAHQQVAFGCLEERDRLLENRPGDLGKGPGATGLHFAGGFLAVGGVKYPVACECVYCYMCNCIVSMRLS